MRPHRTCDGIRRRDFFKAGILGFAGLSLADYLRLARANEVAERKATGAIFINLGGGPSHLDTFDMKPDAGSEFRGEFNPIDTKSPGVRICEHLPRLASCTDKFAILRGVSHTLAAHQMGSQYMNTGNRPLPSLEFPGYGAVVSKEISGRADVPAFVAIPNTPQRPGYLGVRYAPLATEAEPKLGKPFVVRGVSLGKGVEVTQVERRQKLLTELDVMFRGHEDASDLVDGLDEFDRQAYDVISSTRSREAFDVGLEPPEIAADFGGHNFGQSCLLAVRLVQAGVRFATINFSGWDTHQKNFAKLKNVNLPQLDQALAAMFRALDVRGLLHSTAVMVTGEFGRTPKINKNAGRDHWPRAMFVMMGGGGILGGQVIGASDERGMEPAAEAITPERVAASFYHALGIDYQKEYYTATRRPVMIVRDGTLIPGLFA
jgi:hypothetical protein